MSEHRLPLPENPLTIGIVLYPGMTLIDLVGPQSALGMHGNTHLFWKNLDPVPCDSGISLLPTTKFSEFDGALDVLMVPGGYGTNDAMQDNEIIDFLVRVAEESRYITSVCSGALVLGMAGLLEGRYAATHWAAYDALPAFGAIPINERVVTDGSRITGGGATAGIDFGLRVLAELRGEFVAKLTQLAMEYDPEPPFNTGHPRNAEPELVAAVQDIIGDSVQQAISIAANRRKCSAA